jgi:hypothetical protein
MPEMFLFLLKDEKEENGVKRKFKSCAIDAEGKEKERNGMIMGPTVRKVNNHIMHGHGMKQNSRAVAVAVAFLLFVKKCSRTPPLLTPDRGHSLSLIFRTLSTNIFLSLSLLFDAR